MKMLKWTAIAMFLTLSLVGARHDNLTDRMAFREACELSRYNCRGAKAPMVAYSTIVTAAGAYGIYAGDNTVWLAKGLSREMRYTVLVHEMVHYLQTKVGGTNIPFHGKFTQCVSESEAFEISDIVAKRVGADDMIRNGDLESYGC
jgi:hypothetical protein